MRYHLIQAIGYYLKTQETIHAGEGVEKREFSYTVDGNVNWYNHHGVCSDTSVMPNSLRPVDCSLPGSSVHGILQTRILEWVAIPFFRGFSQPRH